MKWSFPTEPKDVNDVFADLTDAELRLIDKYLEQTSKSEVHKSSQVIQEKKSKRVLSDENLYDKLFESIYMEPMSPLEIPGKT